MPKMSESSGRLEFLDAIRGYALLTITINHMSGMTGRGGRTSGHVPTLSEFGFSSAAELFVMTSGLLFGLVYLGKDRWTFVRKSIDRIGRIYLVNGLLLSLLLAVALTGERQLAEIAALTKSRVVDEGMLWRTLTLRGGPYLGGILTLYIYLIGFLMLIRLATSRAKVAVGISIAVYLASLLIDERQLDPIVAIGFNIFAWQLLFVLSAYLAPWLRDKFAARNDTPWLIRGFVVCAIAFVALSAPRLAEIAQLYPVTDFAPILFDKWSLGPIRVLHALVAFATLSFAFSLLQRWAPWLFRPIAMIGACSLETFAASVVANYIGTLVWLDGSRSVASYLAVTAAAVLAVALFGIGLRAWRLLGSTSRPRPPSPAPIGALAPA